MSETTGIEILWIRDFFETNRILVYAAYGLVFILMGVAIAVQSMKHTRLALGKHLWLLAIFGLIHGFNEWGDAFIPIQASWVSPEGIATLEVVQLGLLLFSFLLLLLFACRLLLGPDRDRQSALIVLLLGSSAVVFTIVSAALASEPSMGYFLIMGKAWIRFLVGFPAALGTGIALYAQARLVEAQALPRIARWLRAAAWSFGVYAVLTGIITPTHKLLLANWSHSSLLAGLAGIPLPVLRAIPAAFAAFNMIRSLHVFQIETDHLLEEARQEKLLVAERELEAMSDIAVTLGGSRTPGTIPRKVLWRILDLLKLQGGQARLSTAEGELLVSIGEWTQSLPSLDRLDHLGSSISHGQVVSLRGENSDWWIGIPVMAKQQVLGMLELLSPDPISLAEQEQQCLISIGNQIGIALENARLWKEVQRKEEIRTELLSRVIGAQEEERIRVARELHDEVGQTLNGLVIRMGAAIEALPPEAARARWILEGNRELLTDGIHELRNLILRLRPTALDDLGLVPALRRLGRQLGQDYGFRFSLRTAGLPARLPRSVETVLFRVAQEALTNVAKHASATAASVNLSAKDGVVETVVMDNGQGFDVTRVLDIGNGQSFGLLGIQERASLVGGTLQIVSDPGISTRLTVRIPLSEGMVPDEQVDTNSVGR